MEKRNTHKYNLLAGIFILLFLVYMWRMPDFPSRKVISAEDTEPYKNIISNKNVFVKSSVDTGMVKVSRFTRMKFGEVYILGVAGGNSSESASWDIFKIYAVVGRAVLKYDKLSCCFKYRLNNVTEYLNQPIVNIHHPVPQGDLTATHYTCNNPKTEQKVIPDGVGLKTSKHTCGEDFVTYVRPYLPLREPGVTLALSSKAAYGNISAEMIIEWMETYKYLGVDKIVTHYLRTINKKALDVLKYYASTGILDLYSHEPANSDELPRVFDNDDTQFWNDKQMIVYDAFERTSGYTYFGQIDHDEFLIPSGNRSLKQMMNDLYEKYKQAAGFVFRTQYFYLSWGKTDSDGDFLLKSYIKRPSIAPHIDNEKTIFKPQNVRLGTIHVHWTKPVNGLERVDVPANEGFIRHYRNCRHSGYVDIEELCLYKMKRMTDTSMADWSERIKHNVEYVRNKVLGIQ